MLKLTQCMVSKLITNFVSQEMESESVCADNVTADVLRPVEGTVILHVNFAVKQDLELGKELLKLAKLRMHLSTFLIAILLSVSRIQRFEEPIMDLLRSWVQHNQRDDLRRKYPLWIEGVSRLPRGDNASGVLLSVVEQSAYGWDHLIPSLVRLALSLADSQQSRFASKGEAGDGTVALGLNLLFALFKRHEIVRSEILEQIFARVITKADSATQYLDLLSRFVMIVVLFSWM